MRANLIYSTQSGKNMGIESRFTAEQIEEFRRFEDKEIDLFLHRDYPKKEIQRLFGKLNKEKYSLILLKSKDAIRKSIDDFLENEGMTSSSIYIADYGKFCWFDNIENNIIIGLQDLELNQNAILTYAEDVPQGYRTFLCNDSYNRFTSRYNIS